MTMRKPAFPSFFLIRVFQFICHSYVFHFTTKHQVWPRQICCVKKNHSNSKKSLNRIMPPKYPPPRKKNKTISKIPQPAVFLLAYYFFFLSSFFFLFFDLGWHGGESTLNMEYGIQECWFEGHHPSQRCHGELSKTLQNDGLNCNALSPILL